MEQYRAFNNLSSYWMVGNGRDSDIVISSRVRFARNVKGLAFPEKLTVQQEREFLNKISSLNLTGEHNKTDDFEFYDLSLIPREEKQVLVEKHMISPAMALSEGVGGLLINAAETVSVMINEEDHLRIQSIYPAYSLREAYNKAQATAKWLEEEIPFAYSASYGYLTACPTNTGTGLRASVMLHLPALVLTKKAGKILRSLEKYGFTARGLYGEGTEPAGNLFQISNQITLGISDEDIIRQLMEFTEEIIALEREARGSLLREHRLKTEDMIYRNEAILKSARLLDINEAFTCLSSLKLGYDLKLIDYNDSHIFNRMLLLMQPAIISKLAGRNLSPEEDMQRRARLFREMWEKTKE